jgi:hypothetical protein
VGTRVIQGGYWRTGGRFHPQLQITSSLVEAPTLSIPSPGWGYPWPTFRWNCQRLAAFHPRWSLPAAPLASLGPALANLAPREERRGGFPFPAMSVKGDVRVN